MRLNKYIAHHASYSRREADKTIQDGFVRVNGTIQINPATQNEEGVDTVYVSGKQVSVRDKYTVIVYHKTRGELVTKSDPRGRRTIYDTLGKEYKHYIPVGRLDFASEGLLLLTDASKIASALMESDLERVYRLKIKGEITRDMESAMLQGLVLEDATAGGHEARLHAVSRRLHRRGQRSCQCLPLEGHRRRCCHAQTELEPLAGGHGQTQRLAI